MTFVDSVHGYRHLLQQADLDRALSLCTGMKGKLRARFIVLSDERVLPPPPFASLEANESRLAMVQMTWEGSAIGHVFGTPVLPLISSLSISHHLQFRPKAPSEPHLSILKVLLLLPGTFLDPHLPLW